MSNRQSEKNYFARRAKSSTLGSQSFLGNNRIRLVESDWPHILSSTSCIKFKTSSRERHSVGFLSPGVSSSSETTGDGRRDCCLDPGLFSSSIFRPLRSKRDDPIPTMVITLFLVDGPVVLLVRLRSVSRPARGRFGTEIRVRVVAFVDRVHG